MAAVRSIFQPRKDNILLAVGITIIRTAPARRKPDNDENQLCFLFASFIEPVISARVQTASALSVQTPDMAVPTPESGSYGHENSAVKSPGANSSLYTEQRTTTENSPAAAPSNRGPLVRLDAAAVGITLKPYGLITPENVSKFCAACRNERSDCTTEDVIAVIRQRAKRISKNVQTPLGILIPEVPKLLAEYIDGGRQQQTMSASVGGGERKSAQPREATPEEIEEHKARGTYVPPKTR